MSGYVLIYDGSGVDSFCSSATYSQIESLMDTRKYQIKYTSELPSTFENTYATPVQLFVIPVGNYKEMEKDLEQLAPRIRQCVVNDGVSYLGICAGAIAATCRPLLMNFNDFVPHGITREKLSYEVVKRDQLHLRFYSGSCCLLCTPDSGRYGVQHVKKISDMPSDPYPLFFQDGVFFLGVDTLPGARSLLEYPFYTFTGSTKEGYLVTSYENETPIAAVTQEVGNGKIVLSGSHPEISSSLVTTFPAADDSIARAKLNTIVALSEGEERQNDTMRDFLNILNITTKKV